MMMAITKVERESSKQGEKERMFFNHGLTSDEQHDSFLSNGSSPTEASSPSSTTDSSSSDEGVDMTSSPSVSSRDQKIKKNLLHQLHQCRKKSSSPDANVLHAYRQLSLDENRKDENDQPIDLSMKNKTKTKNEENKTSPTTNYQWPQFTSSGGITNNFWHTGMLLRNSLPTTSTINPFMAAQHLVTSSPLLGLPFLTNAHSQVNSRPMLYDPNVLAEFSRLLAARQSLASGMSQKMTESSSLRQTAAYENIKQERSSNNPSPASSTESSHKRKADEDKMSLNRVSAIGCEVNSDDSNDSSSSFLQAEKRPRLHNQSGGFFNDLPTYIENNAHFSTPPTMVTGSYNQSIQSTSIKEPTPIDFKPCRYPCTSCGRTYATIGGLVKHSKTHHDPESSKVFKCKSCDKEYTSLGALKMHIRTHTLPCKCHICGKAFSRTWLLQGHIRTHTGEKPYQCSVCMRAFADRSNLRAHMQTHETVKRYACTSCDKTYSRISLLNRHQANGCSGAVGSQES